MVIVSLFNLSRPGPILLKGSNRCAIHLLPELGPMVMLAEISTLRLQNSSLQACRMYVRRTHVPAGRIDFSR